MEDTRPSCKPDKPFRDCFNADAWAKIALLTLLFFLLDVVDMFGMSSATAKHSRDVIYQLMAPFVQSPWRNRISVVMLEDGDLEEFGQAWPVEYGLHAAVLSSIKAHEPAAVFVDVSFIDPRADPSVEDLKQTIVEYRGDEAVKPVPLFLAGMPGENGNDKGIRLDLAERLAEGHVLPVPGGRDEHEGIIYPLWDEQARGPTAAMRLYQAAASLWQRKERSLDARFSANPKLPSMEVVWRVSEHRDRYDRYGEQECINPDGDLVSRFISLLFYGPVDAKKRLRSGCPYHSTIPVRRLFSSGDEIKHLIKDRVVLYGVDIAMVEDLVEPPTHTPLPAVYLHAMALDNLLHYQSRYKNNGDKAAHMSVQNSITLGCLFLLMVVAHYWEMQLATEKSSGLGHQACLLLWWTASSIVLVVLVCIFTFALLDFGVSNWAGLFMFTFIRAHARVVNYVKQLIARALEIARRLNQQP